MTGTFHAAASRVMASLKSATPMGSRLAPEPPLRDPEQWPSGRTAREQLSYSSLLNPRWLVQRQCRREKWDATVLGSVAESRMPLLRGNKGEALLLSHGRLPFLKAAPRDSLAIAAKH